MSKTQETQLQFQIPADYNEDKYPVRLSADKFPAGVFVLADVTIDKVCRISQQGATQAIEGNTDQVIFNIDLGDYKDQVKGMTGHISLFAQDKKQEDQPAWSREVSELCNQIVNLRSKYPDAGIEAIIVGVAGKDNDGGLIVTGCIDGQVPDVMSVVKNAEKEILRQAVRRSLD